MVIQVTLVGISMYETRMYVSYCHSPSYGGTPLELANPARDPGTGPCKLFAALPQNFSSQKVIRSWFSLLNALPSSLKRAELGSLFVPRKTVFPSPAWVRYHTSFRSRCPRPTTCLHWGWHDPTGSRVVRYLRSLCLPRLTIRRRSNQLLDFQPVSQHLQLLLSPHSRYHEVLREPPCQHRGRRYGRRRCLRPDRNRRDQRHSDRLHRLCQPAGQGLRADDCQLGVQRHCE